METEAIVSAMNQGGGIGAPWSQRGAVLYVALVMLILLALLGLVGMRVSGMQERMAANYRNVNAAFQAAEQGARDIELDIQRQLAGGGSYASNADTCASVYDPLTWSNEKTTDQSGDSHIRRIDQCFPSSSLVVGRKVNEETGNIYEVTALDSDASQTATAVIDTIFIP